LHVFVFYKFAVLRLLQVCSSPISTSLFGSFVNVAEMQKGPGKGRGQPMSAWGSSAEPEILYNSRGEPVKGYYLVEEESDAVADHEGGQDSQEPQQQYEYSGSGRQWHSWADAADWNEQYGGNTDYGEN
jgi:hypothetical protein